VYRFRRRPRAERGAVAVEAALVTPLLVLLVFGIIEMSLLLRDYAVVTSNTRTGARIASTGAAAGPATCTPSPCTPPSAPKLAQMAADAIQRTGSAMPVDYIDYIIVYKANDAGYPGALPSLPAATAPCGAAANCVLYRWNESANQFRYVSGTWASTSISACFPGTVANPLDRVGVALQATHKMVTGIFATTFVLRDHTVMNFEPLPGASCKSGGGAGSHL